MQLLPQEYYCVRGEMMYTAIVTVAALAFAAAFILLFIKVGFLRKLLVKLGIQKQSVSMNWTAFSWESCLRKMECTADVVFLGDSLVRGGDFHKQFADTKIINLGSSGDTLSGMMGRVSTVQALEPRKVFLMGGINGLTDQNVACCISLYEDLVLELEKAMPSVPLYLQSILPLSAAKAKKLCKNTTITAFNAGIREIAHKHGHTYIDLHSLYLRDGEMASEKSVDGIHLKPEAYEAWYQAIGPYMK